MTRTIWLASYPKSGNTWLRILLANVLNPAGAPVDINNMVDESIASARDSFDYAALFDSGLLTHDEVDRLRPRIHAHYARIIGVKEGSAEVPRARFIKVHDAYTLNSVGEPLLGGAQGACGAILIVRDPRDVAASLAHYMNWSIDKAISFLNEQGAAFCKKTNRQALQLRQNLGDWSEHAASWLEQTDIPVHVLRYEDLIGNTAGELRRVMEFSSLPTTKKAIDRAVEFSDFAQLQQQERKNGFVEAPVRNWTKEFFRRGKAGSWHDELSCERVARIESRHGRMMQRLGYELSYASNFAYAG